MSFGLPMIFEWSTYMYIMQNPVGDFLTDTHGQLLLLMYPFVRASSRVFKTHSKSFLFWQD
jgi:hypothetical protein